MSSHSPSRKGLSLCAAAATCAASMLAGAGAASAEDSTATPIKHVVVIYSENISFDHYFATYPNAANTAGETMQGSNAPAPSFTAKADTPKVNNLETANLLGDANPNSVKPFRLTPGQAATTDQNHEYSAEQEAANNGAMDKFPETVSTDVDKSSNGYFAAPGLTMGYYDGNTVTGMWNYSQNFSMNDNSFSTIFGPSTPGALNLVAGTVANATMHDPATGEQATIEPGKSSALAGVPADGKTATVVGDPDPLYDDCSNASSASTNKVAALSDKNIGDQMNENGVTWGWFQGGFRPTEQATDSSRARCGSAHKTLTGQTQADYNPHHEPFQYYASTANPHHLAPSSDSMIGQTDQANHQYDLSDFDTALKNGNLPAVSFLKAANYQDGHAGYSNPYDEQAFMTHYINELQNSKEWDSTAVIIAYDDSDGWYDHQAPKILNGSNDTTIDEETGSPVDAEICTSAAQSVGVAGGSNGQCGPGTRQPLLVISPYSKVNYVDSTYTEQTSITKFIQDNWNLGRLGGNSFDDRAGVLNNMFDFAAGATAPKVFLNETDGTVASSYEEVKKVDDSSRATTGLKSVADGMNDPTVTEQGTSPQVMLSASSQAETSGSSSKGLWAGVGIGVVVVLGVIAWLASRRKSSSAK
ncbi:phospholipase C [Corynebacterium vitaeruminis]|uniref:Acid phosphatase n=1 Tax=Corynebacterium vitaeruminis DSM 20294 TaxID=1224164 RepID=W5Y296_9CORY|nr:alkaline phosphatase family protein [Corynebacterium vitaeruminis]AHI23337.1 acid phosphatase [Corynebacterium vitaeruminis DSM 20294]